MMSNYKDVDTELTRISASLSDHVFIGKEVKKNDVQFVAVVSKFSDYNSVLLTLFKK